MFLAASMVSKTTIVFIICGQGTNIQIFFPNDQCFTFYILSTILNIYIYIYIHTHTHIHHTTYMVLHSIIAFPICGHGTNIFGLTIFFPIINALNLTFCSPILNINYCIHYKTMFFGHNHGHYYSISNLWTWY